MDPVNGEFLLRSLLHRWCTISACICGFVAPNTILVMKTLTICYSGSFLPAKKTTLPCPPTSVPFRCSSSSHIPGGLTWSRGMYLSTTSILNELLSPNFARYQAASSRTAHYPNGLGQRILDLSLSCQFNRVRQLAISSFGYSSFGQER